MTGEIWLAYERTKDENLKSGAASGKSLLKRITERVDVDNHDMGFPLYSVLWRLTGLPGDETAKSRPYGSG